MTERHIAKALPNAVLVRNPVNLDPGVDYPLTYPAGSEPFQMSMVSRINCYTKGHDYLLEALASPELRAAPLISQHLRRRRAPRLCREMIAYYGLAGKVRYARSQ